MSPESAPRALATARLEKAQALLEDAKLLFSVGQWASANNRAYYCLFHAMRAVLALDGEDYKKHSAVIARFALQYLKTRQLPDHYGKLIANASLIRNRSDYEDFYICSLDDTRQLVSGAEAFWQSVSAFLQQKYTDA